MLRRLIVPVFVEVVLLELSRAAEAIIGPGVVELRPFVDVCRGEQISMLLLPLLELVAAPAVGAHARGRAAVDVGRQVLVRRDGAVVVRQKGLAVVVLSGQLVAIVRVRLRVIFAGRTGIDCLVRG